MNEPDPLRYVALGDSLAAGLHSYVPVYARLVKERVGVPVLSENHARNGWTSLQILGFVQRNARVRAALSTADIVTVNAGGNDLLPARVQFEMCGDVQCISDAVTRLAEGFHTLLREIVSLRDSAEGIVTMDLYQPFVAAEIQAGTFEQMAGHMAATNGRIRAVAASFGIPVANVHETLNGPTGRDDAARAGLLWLDGIHPSAAGADAIARALFTVSAERVAS